VVVPTGTLSAVGFAPVVVTSDHQEVEIPAGATLISGLVPTVDVSRSAAPGAGTLTISGLAPTPVVALAVEPDELAFTLYIDSARAWTANIEQARAIDAYIDQAWSIGPER
jgi:hypothetical protein